MCNGKPAGKMYTTVEQHPVQHDRFVRLHIGRNWQLCIHCATRRDWDTSKAVVCTSTSTLMHDRA